MRKDILSIGLVLIVIGVIASSLSCSKVENHIPEGPLYEAPPYSWEVRGEYKAGWKLLVYFKPPNLDLFPDYIANITVEVSHKESGRKTVFSVIFRKMFDRPLWPEFKLLHNDGALKVEQPLGEIGGVALYDGEYVANITSRGFWGPPEKLELWTERIEVAYPNLNYLPFGLISLVIGMYVAFSGYRRQSYRRLRKLRSKPKR